MDSQLFSAFLCELGYLTNYWQSDSSFSTRGIHLNKQVYYISASWDLILPVGHWRSQKEYMNSPVYDKEAEVDHRCLITLNVMCLAMTAKVKPSECYCLKIGGS